MALIYKLDENESENGISESGAGKSCTGESGSVNSGTVEIVTVRSADLLPQIKVHLINGDHLPRADSRYLPPGREGNECRARCPRWPGYHCSRSSNHSGDHAAHGWAKGVARRLIVMYARWSR